MINMNCYNVTYTYLLQLLHVSFKHSTFLHFLNLISIHSIRQIHNITFNYKGKHNTFFAPVICMLLVIKDERGSQKGTISNQLCIINHIIGMDQYLILLSTYPINTLITFQNQQELFVALYSIDVMYHTDQRLQLEKYSAKIT